MAGVQRDTIRELGAIPIVLVVLGLLGVIMVAAVAGAWVWVALGVGAFVVLVAVVIVVMARPHRPAAGSTPSLPVGAAQHPDDGVHRALLIVDVDCPPDDLGTAIGAEGMLPTGVEVFVIAPALSSRTARWTGDEHAYQEAATHLDATLAALAALNIDARGHVGSHDPLQAAEDGLREFPADEIVLAVHPAGEKNWLEQGVADAARARYALPVREVVVARS
jgi:hypothetical protein